MIKPINFRPILFCALSLIFGIILFKFSPALGVLTFLLPIFLFALIFFLFFIFGEKDKRKLALFTVGACFCFSLIGIAVLGVNVSVISGNRVQNGVYQVDGVVESVSYKDGRYYVGLTECVYDGNSGGDLFLYASEQKVSLYDVISLKGYVCGVDKTEGKAINSQILSGYSATCSNYYDLQIVGKKRGVATYFKTKTDDMFVAVLGDKFGVLSALLRGDVSEMRETVSTFRLVGIAHVFAVSGMHIGLIFTALAFLLKSIPLSRLKKRQLFVLRCFSIRIYVGLHRRRFALRLCVRV